MKLLALEVGNAGHAARLASYRLPGKRTGSSSWLDELAAAVNQFGAPSIGSAVSKENLCTSCSQCNSRKPSPADKWERPSSGKSSKGKCVDPQDWDGLASVFVMLADRNPARLTVDETEWLKALRPNRNLVDLAS
jgi:hypothetical protein